MTPHSWEQISLNIGNGESTPFWLCKACGASGGSVFSTDKGGPHAPPHDGFLVGTSLGRLGDDCAIAKLKIDNYIEKYPQYRELVASERGAQIGVHDHTRTVLVSTAIELAAECMYKAFTDALYSQFEMLTWTNLPENIRQSWVAAARFAQDYFKL
jgi:hypothetical protein